jgi:hypothetical protein
MDLVWLAVVAGFFAAAAFLVRLVSTLDEGA